MYLQFIITLGNCITVSCPALMPARRSRMIIRRLFRSSSQVESTHAENLIRSIGCTDLIADTQAKWRERRRKRERKREGRREKIWYSRQSRIHRRLN